jgi:hypothetical protein
MRSSRSASRAQFASRKSQVVRNSRRGGRGDRARYPPSPALRAPRR